MHCLILHANTLPGKAAVQAALERKYNLIRVSRVSGSGHQPKNSFVLDTSDPKAVEDLAIRLEKDGLQIDCLVTCPAFNPKECKEDTFRSFEDFESANWDKIIRENLNAQMLFCKFFGKEMRRRGRGRILQLASNVALEPHAPRQFAGVSSELGSAHACAAYASAMGGVLSLTRFLAADYRDSGVLINSVVFGPLAEIESDAFLDSYKDRVPLGKAMTFEDLKNILDVFLDPDSLYITGQNLIADGGVSIW